STATTCEFSKPRGHLTAVLLKSRSAVRTKNAAADAVEMRFKDDARSTRIMVRVLHVQIAPAFGQRKPASPHDTRGQHDAFGTGTCSLFPSTSRLTSSTAIRAAERVGSPARTLEGREIIGRFTG